MLNAGAKRYDQRCDSKIQALSSHPPSGLFHLYMKWIVCKKLRSVECHCALFRLEDWGILIWRWMQEPRGMTIRPASRFKPWDRIPPVAFTVLQTSLLIYIFKPSYLVFKQLENSGIPLCSRQAWGLRNSGLKVNAGAKRYDQRCGSKIQALSSHPPSGLFHLYMK